MMSSMSFQIKTHPHSEVSALIVHGLNNHPNVMNDVENFLKHQHVNTCKIALTGHHNDVEAFKKVEFSNWVEDIKDGNQELTQFKRPIVLIAFSLGALVGVTSLLQDENIHFAGMFLFAPAFRTHWYTWPMKFVSFFGRHIMIPSSAPEDYRANKATSAAAYEELFKGQEYFEKSISRDKRRLLIPTEIFIDPKDELVSLSGLKSLITKYKLKKHWRINKIKSKSKYSHLIIDKKSLGQSQWYDIEEKLEKIIQAASI